MEISFSKNGLNERYGVLVLLNQEGPHLLWVYFTFSGRFWKTWLQLKPAVGRGAAGSNGNKAKQSIFFFNHYDIGGSDVL